MAERVRYEHRRFEGDINGTVRDGELNDIQEQLSGVSHGWGVNFLNESPRDHDAYVSSFLVGTKDGLMSYVVHAANIHQKKRKTDIINVEGHPNMELLEKIREFYYPHTGKQKPLPEPHSLDPAFISEYWNREGAIERK